MATLNPLQWRSWLAHGDEARVEAILGAYRRWASKAKATPLKVVVANDVYNKARELAGGYGLAECEKSPFEGA